jgi:dipeptidyl aminopeptidase/acylaminoacyl peptidase
MREMRIQRRREWRVTMVAVAMGCLMVGEAGAQHKLTVEQFNQAGPFAVTAPVAFDSIDVGGKHFEQSSLMGGVSLKAAPTAVFSGQVLPSLEEELSVGVLSFYLNNSDYLKGSIEVKGPKNYKLYVDGKETSSLQLAPEHHTISIKYLAQPRDTDSIRVTLDTQLPAKVTLDGRHPYMVHDLFDGRRVRSVSLSPDGRYVCVGYQTTERDGRSHWNYELRDVKTQKVIATPPANTTWMPKTAEYVTEETIDGQRTLFRVNPVTGQRELWTSGVPKGSYDISPTEDYLIVAVEEEGPKEDRDVFQVVEMDDRQPRWRTRSYLVRHDVKTGMNQRLTFGTRGEELLDISADGSKLLVYTSRSRLERRPTSVADYIVMDARTLKADTVLHEAEFLGGACFSPDATQLLIKGTPEAFARIGCQLPESVTPSMTENELFLYDLKGAGGKRVAALTRDFDPSVEKFVWSLADGQVYFTAENEDYMHLYKLNTKTGKIERMPVKGDYIYRFDMATQATTMAWLAYQTMEPASAYVADKPGAKNAAVLFNGREALGDAELGTCQDWDYENSKGDTVHGRLYLPKDLDPKKKYPMIVYYYGGCSPTSRYFESPYAPQYWNSLGYVAYIVEPSGATGFGQEWASRHVNTAGGEPQGDGTVPGGTPAGDIIEGVKKICAEHPYIDAQHIGCMGASYGGFMTQYLQTVTDIFAAAVSHAGIANHTSYWGEGYWGYNYSEVSMANSYPWSHRQL